MRFAVWTTGTLAGLALVFMLAVLVSARPGDPKLFPAREGEQSLEVLLVNNGYHSGLVLPRASVATLAAAQGQSAVVAVARRFAAYDWVEVGWGEARSYREVPTIDRLSWRLALSALFGPNNEAVLHVVGLWDEPQEVFRGAERVSLRISAEGAARLLARSRSVPRVSRRNSVQGSTDQACSIGRRAASTSSMFATIGLRISSTLQAFQPLPCWRRCRGAWCWIFAGDPS